MPLRARSLALAARVTPRMLPRGPRLFQGGRGRPAARAAPGPPPWRPAASPETALLVDEKNTW